MAMLIHEVETSAFKPLKTPKNRFIGRSLVKCQIHFFNVDPHGTL